MQPKSETALRTPMQRASKRAPTRYSWPLASKSLWCNTSPPPRITALRRGQKSATLKHQSSQKVGILGINLLTLGRVEPLH